MFVEHIDWENSAFYVHYIEIRKKSKLKRSQSVGLVMLTLHLFGLIRFKISYIRKLEIKLKTVGK